eukprot:6198754-Pleurochrysis_carterae.AAC.1
MARRQGRGITLCIFSALWLCFRSSQLKEDSEEDLATIPRVGMADLERKVRTVPTDVEQLPNGATLLTHPLPTAGVVYADVLLDLVSARHARKRSPRPAQIGVDGPRSSPLIAGVSLPPCRIPLLTSSLHPSAISSFLCEAFSLSLTHTTKVRSEVSPPR